MAFFNQANALEYAKQGHEARRAKSKPTNGNSTYSQALELQDLLLNDARRETIKPLERSSVARVWCELEETKRKLKMKPLPGSLRPTAKPQRKVKDRAEFTPAASDSHSDANAQLPKHSEPVIPKSDTNQA